MSQFICTAGGTKGKIHLNPPAKCDLCETPIISKFYDVKVGNRGWANLCTSCFKATSSKLGVGLGQEFTAKAE